MKTTDFNRKGGQAMIEFVIGLVGIILLTALVVFLGQIQIVDTDSLTRASGDAIGDSMGNAIASSFTPIDDWDDGLDGRAYTKDDRADKGNFYGLRTHITSATAPGGDWSGTKRADGAPALYDDVVKVDTGTLAQSTFGFVSSGDSESISVPPVLQDILGLPAEITIRNEVWMPKTGGLY